MKITLVAVGRLKEAHWRDGAAEYLKRLRPYATVDVVEVADRDVTRDEARALAEESVDLLRALPDGAHVIALDIGGEPLTSEGLADVIADHMVGGRSHVAFVLGGAAGLTPSVLARADARLSLGQMTLPHQLARVVLLEQVYRAFRIMRKEPYHR
jgi:23S rRNA (pseudouridine1915-N3)-methyltransferase